MQILFLVGFLILFQCTSSVALADFSLVSHFKVSGSGKNIDDKTVSAIRTEIDSYFAWNGTPYRRVTPELQAAFEEIESLFYDRFTPEAQLEFQQILAEHGARMKHPDRLKVPKAQTSYWKKDPGNLYGYKSSDRLPQEAEIVIIGAGLTGASAAYHLIDEAQAGKKVIVLEAGPEPANESSGKNGGNFQLFSESYTQENYEGMLQERLKALKAKNEYLDQASLYIQARKDALALLNFSLRNFQLFIDIVEKEKIQCDLSREGWLKIASSSSEAAALQSDTELFQSLSSRKKSQLPEMKLLTPSQIYELFKIPAEFPGKLVLGSGNYHPYKFVTELLNRALDKNVELYTGIQVRELVDLSLDSVTIRTSQGNIKAKKVILATNAFTGSLYPEMKDHIVILPSQVMNLEYVKNTFQGMTITFRNGDFYVNFPASTWGQGRGMVHFGLDFPEPVQNPNHIPVNEELYWEMKAKSDELFPETQGQPPSRIWTGPMAFTRDRVPILGFMYKQEQTLKRYKNVVIAGAFQGYGGSLCIEAGEVSAEMVRTGEIPQGFEEELFSPKRFLDKPKLFIKSKL